MVQKWLRQRITGYMFDSTRSRYCRAGIYQITARHLDASHGISSKAWRLCYKWAIRFLLMIQLTTVLLSLTPENRARFRKNIALNAGHCLFQIRFELQQGTGQGVYPVCHRYTYLALEKNVFCCLL